MTRVLVTGAGGPAGVAIIRSLINRPEITVSAADMDQYASGLYLVEEDGRHLVPPGLSAEFVDHVLELCTRNGIDILFPTVDVELEPLVARRADFAANGIAIAAPSLHTLNLCLDKLRLAEHCRDILPTPVTATLGPQSDAIDWQFPVITKPRRGAGSRGIRQVDNRADLTALGTDDNILVQEFLPGDEYSVDVIADLEGTVLAAVPRSRLRVDSGVSVAGATLHDEELEGTATAVARAIKLTTVANVQLRRNREGIAALLEVNPRFPGAMPLTIAAGIDMPALTVDMHLGLPIPASLPFRELTVVRYLDDIFLDSSDLVSGPIRPVLSIHS